jgi:hypothetical protein
VGETAELNPAQQEVLDRLAAPLAERPRFDPALGKALRTKLEDGLAPLAAELDPAKPLRVDKHLLASVHACQAKWLAELGAPFEPSVPVVRGTVAHKAIELSLNAGGDPSPGELADWALERVEANDAWVAEWLAGVGAAERAELRGAVVDLVVKFTECWPPLHQRWRPVSEATWWCDLLGDRVVLKGRADLTVGVPQGDVAGKVVVDLKTGGFSPTHREDLRFYALVETLRLGVPPRLIVTHYLDAGRLDTEEVTVPLLEATVARVTDGVFQAVALRNGELEPAVRPGAACRWCLVLDSCEAGRDHLLR